MSRKARSDLPELDGPDIMMPAPVMATQLAWRVSLSTSQAISYFGFGQANFETCPLLAIRTVNGHDRAVMPFDNRLGDGKAKAAMLAKLLARWPVGMEAFENILAVFLCNARSLVRDLDDNFLGVGRGQYFDQSALW